MSALPGVWGLVKIGKVSLHSPTRDNHKWLEKIALKWRLKWNFCFFKTRFSESLCLVRRIGSEEIFIPTTEIPSAKIADLVPKRTARAMGTRLFFKKSAICTTCKAPEGVGDAGHKLTFQKWKVISLKVVESSDLKNWVHGSNWHFGPLICRKRAQSRFVVFAIARWAICKALLI